MNKTKGKKFNKIKKRAQPLTKILKEIFCEFDKNEIHEERTFIFSLRSPSGAHDDYYIINYKDDLLRKFNDYSNYSDYSDNSDNSYDNDDIKSLFLPASSYKKNVKDKRRFECYNIVLDESLYEGKKEYKL